MGRCFICTELQGLECVGTLLWPAQCKEVSEVTNPGVVTSVPSSPQVCTCFLQPRLWGFGECKAQSWGLCPAQYWASTEGSTLPRAGPVLGPHTLVSVGPLLGQYCASTGPVLGHYWGLYPAQSLATTEAPALLSTGPLLRAPPCPGLHQYSAQS